MSIFHDPSSILRQGRKELQEKAVSQAQQKFMGMVYAAKKGETPASPEVAKAAEGMSKKEARKFAKTKHEGLPTRKEEVEQIEESPLVAGGLALGGALAAAAAIRTAQQGAKAGVEAAKKGEKIKPGTSIGHAAYGMQKRSDALNAAMKQLRNSYEPEIVNHLIENGFAETEQNALKIVENMGESWVEEILTELNRLEKEQGKKSGGNPDKAYQHVRKTMRNMTGRPAGQRKKEPGKKPPAAGEYGAPKSPAQKVALRRAAEKRSQDMQSSRYD